jgi:hypothetical protein
MEAPQSDTQNDIHVPTEAEKDQHHSLPDLRGPLDTPVLYLPPLLSRLPSQDVLPLPSSSVVDSAFRFDKPGISYTKSFLPSIDQASLDLHRALHHFRPTSAGYASRPYAQAFNWDELELPEETEREW